MPVRFVPLANEQYYHIFNRGVAKQPVFLDKKAYNRFLLTLSYYRYSRLPLKLSRLLQLSVKDRTDLFTHLPKRNGALVEILCCVLMPNHFHLLVKQKRDNGISTFLRRSINSYTRYFNTKNKRNGPLFQGAFKAVRIESEEQLLHVSRYIHLNPLVSYVVKEANFIKYPWSSFQCYIGNNDDKFSFIDTSAIHSYFTSATRYKKFIYDHDDYAKKLESIKHLTFEELEENPDVS
jgi:putative transposase